MSELTQEKKQVLLTARIMWFAMVMAVTIITLVFAIIVPLHDEEAETGVLHLIVAVLAIGGLVVSFALGKVMSRQVWQGGQFNAQAFIAAVLAKLIPLEGVAILALVLALVNGSLFPMAFGVILVLLFMLVQFPRTSEVTVPPPGTHGARP